MRVPQSQPNASCDCPAPDREPHRYMIAIICDPSMFPENSTHDPVRTLAFGGSCVAAAVSRYHHLKILVGRCIDLRQQNRATASGNKFAPGICQAGICGDPMSS
jgi:hypothetical protein